MANFVSNEDALEVLDKYAKGIKKGIGVVAVRETSPAAAAHAVGDYIRYSGTVYKVKSAISIGDSLILNTNIEANDLPDDTTIYTPGLDNVSGISNPNLLDNPFFTVNSRGLSSYSNTGYCVDRWVMTSAGTDLTVSFNGIASFTGPGWFYQIMKDFVPAGPITISACIDGAIYSYTFNNVNDGSAQTHNSGDLIDHIQIQLAERDPNLSGKDGFAIKFSSISANHTISAVKLELGSVSTLVNDVAPDYAIELAKCQTSTADPNDTYANQGQLMTSALQGVYGSKNLLPNEGISTTSSGVTFTVNDDKSITINADGTNASAVDFYLYNHNNSVHDDWSGAILSGISGGSNTTYQLIVQYRNPNMDWLYLDDGEVNLPNINTFDSVRIRVYANTALTNVTVNPMIRDARISDSTYVPYAMTNRELTEEFIYKNITISSLNVNAGEYVTLVATDDVNMPHYDLVSVNFEVRGAGGGFLIVSFVNVDPRYPHIEAYNPTSGQVSAAGKVHLLYKKGNW